MAAMATKQKTEEEEEQLAKDMAEMFAEFNQAKDKEEAADIAKAALPPMERQRSAPLWDHMLNPRDNGELDPLDLGGRLERKEIPYDEAVNEAREYYKKEEAEKAKGTAKLKGGKRKTRKRRKGGVPAPMIYKKRVDKQEEKKQAKYYHLMKSARMRGDKQKQEELKNKMKKSFNRMNYWNTPGAQSNKEIIVNATVRKAMPEIEKSIKRGLVVPRKTRTKSAGGKRTQKRKSKQYKMRKSRSKTRRRKGGIFGLSKAEKAKSARASLAKTEALVKRCIGEGIPEALCHDKVAFGEYKGGKRRRRTRKRKRRKRRKSRRKR